MKGDNAITKHFVSQQIITSSSDLESLATLGGVARKHATHGREDENAQEKSTRQVWRGHGYHFD